jgi:hypothetical protein
MPATSRTSRVSQLNAAAMPYDDFDATYGEQYDADSQGHHALHRPWDASFARPQYDDDFYDDTGRCTTTSMRLGFKFLPGWSALLSSPTPLPRQPNHSTMSRMLSASVHNDAQRSNVHRGGGFEDDGFFDTHTNQASDFDQYQPNHGINMQNIRSNINSEF